MARININPPLRRGSRCGIDDNTDDFKCAADLSALDAPNCAI